MSNEILATIEFLDGFVATVEKEYYPTHPRELYDTLANLVQLDNRNWAEIDEPDYRIAGILDYCNLRTLPNEQPYNRVISNDEEYKRGVVKRYVSMFCPDIVWCGFLSSVGYSQGDYLNMFAYVTVEDMERWGLDPSDIARAERLAREEFREYSAYAWGDVFTVDYDYLGDRYYSEYYLSGSDVFDPVPAVFREEFGQTIPLSVTFH